MPDQYHHPAFPQPDDGSIILWRYMDLNKFSWLIDEESLFMPSASKLGDPLEGTTPTGELKSWEQRASEADTDEQREIIRENRIRLSAFAQQFRNHHYYVSCWHKNTYENYAMWGCYTKTKEAVAIFTSYDTLRACVPDFVLTGEVRYIDYTCDRLPSMNLYEHIMHKDIYYSYEQEIRAVASPPATDELGRSDFISHYFFSETDPEFRFYAPPVKITQLIHGLILHPQASQVFAQNIAEICREKCLPSPQASRSNHPPRF